MIRRSHTHADGKVCFRVRDRGGRPFTQMGMFQPPGDKAFVAAYLGFTGHWYAFDPESGRELGTFTRDFYEQWIAQHRTHDLVVDPDCKP